MNLYSVRSQPRPRQGQIGAVGRVASAVRIGRPEGRDRTPAKDNPVSTLRRGRAKPPHTQRHSRVWLGSRACPLIALRTHAGRRGMSEKGPIGGPQPARLCHKPWPRGIARHERVIAAIACDEPRSRVTAWQHPALLERHDAVVAANWELPEPSHGSGAVLPLAARQSDVRFVSH